MLRWALYLLILGGGAVVTQHGAAATGSGPLETLIRAVAAAPQDMLAGDRLRRVCREQQAVARCVEFFEQLVAKYPYSDALRFNAALAYVDSLPNHTLLLQAAYSSHSIEHASAVLKREPDNWLALYIRGLNNLYWPLWYQRTDWSIADLTRCTQMARSLPADQRHPYMALSFVALGDVYARLDQIPAAIDTWKEGLRLVPSQQLQQRLAIAPASIHEVVEKIRNRDVPVDTGLEVFMPAARGNPS